MTGGELVILGFLWIWYGLWIHEDVIAFYNPLELWGQSKKHFVSVTLSLLPGVLCLVLGFWRIWK